MCDFELFKKLQMYAAEHQENWQNVTEDEVNQYNPYKKEVPEYVSTNGWTMSAHASRP